MTTVENAASLAHHVAAREPGTSVAITYQRGGRTATVTATIPEASDLGGNAA